MKWLIVAALGLVISMSKASAQEFVAPRLKPVPPPEVHQPVADRRPAVSGIVAQIFNVKKPWQLVNPLAPKSYGDGRKMVSYSEKDPGKPKGFIVASVEW